MSEEQKFLRACFPVTTIRDNLSLLQAQHYARGKVVVEDFTPMPSAQGHTLLSVPANQKQDHASPHAVYSVLYSVIEWKLWLPWSLPACLLITFRCDVSFLFLRLHLRYVDVGLTTEHML